MRTYRKLIAFITVLSFGTYAHITFAATRTLTQYVGLITDFISKTLIPFFFALAILFFLFNIARYFIIKGGDASAREQARKFAMYGLIAFVFLFSIWGITNMILDAFNLDNGTTICPDYNPNCKTR